MNAAAGLVQVIFKTAQQKEKTLTRRGKESEGAKFFLVFNERNAAAGLVQVIFKTAQQKEKTLMRRGKESEGAKFFFLFSMR